MKVNETVRLMCDYSLTETELYSVKWSHDDQGFYRFFPRLEEPRQVFPSSVLTVDLAQSDCGCANSALVAPGLHFVFWRHHTTGPPAPTRPRLEVVVVASSVIRRLAEEREVL